MNNNYLLLSTDEFLIKRKVDEILKVHNLSDELLESYNLDENDIIDLVNNLSTDSFFDDARIYWLKNPTLVEGSKALTDAEIKAFNSYLDSDSKNILIISSTNYNKDNKIKELLNKYFEKINLDKESMSLDEFLNKYIMDNNLNISEFEKKEVLNRSHDFQTLENNLIKLDCYANGSKITMEMVDKLTNKEIESKLYDITQAMFDGNNGVAYTALENLLNDNFNPSTILAGLKAAFTLLLYAAKLYKRGRSQEDIARELNISSGRAYHLIRNVKTLGDEVIEGYLKNLHKINVDSRSGNGDERMLLELFVLKNK